MGLGLVWVLCVVGKFTVGQFYCHFVMGLSSMNCEDNLFIMPLASCIFPILSLRNSVYPGNLNNRRSTSLM